MRHPGWDEKAAPVAVLSRAAQGGRAVTDRPEHPPQQLWVLCGGATPPGFALFPFVIVFVEMELQTPARTLTAFNPAALSGSLKLLYCPLRAATSLGCSSNFLRGDRSSRAGSPQTPGEPRMG